jgi:acetolactate synthase-1/2/3 large subunit
MSTEAALKKTASPIPYGQTMPAREAFVYALREAGVEDIFGYPGGAILPVYEGLETVPHEMTHILTAAEAGAGHMAAGYARATGKTGVLLVTSGPGITNAITPMADAHRDSTPMVVISGQVPTHLMGTDAFQEAPATMMTQQITKHNMLVRKGEDLVPMIRKAFRIAAEGRPGVVHIDIPKDVQNATVTYPPREAPAPAPAAVPAEAYRYAAEMMSRAVRPVFYIGGGVTVAGPEAAGALTQMLNDTGFPAAQTLMGLGAYPTAHPSHLGLMGMHGTYESNMAMHHADLIVAIGARFDDRVTGKIYNADGSRAFAPGAKIIHIDVDRAEISKIVPADVGIVADAGEAIAGLHAAWQACKIPASNIGAWWRQIEEWRSVQCLDIEPGADDIRAQSVMQELGKILEGLSDYVVTTNVGQHQMWAAQYLPFRHPRQFITSGGLGTMGFGLPAAIGAQWTMPRTPVICITGDGSWRMNANEVETASRFDLPVKVLMLNNRALDMVGQWGRNNHNGCKLESEFTHSTKDFLKEFRAQGDNARAERVSHPSQLPGALARMMAYNDGPYLLEVAIRGEDCLPIVEAGKAHNDMKFSKDVIARHPRLAAQ